MALHEDPKIVVKFPKDLAKYLCSASQQAELHPVVVGGNQELARILTNRPDDPGYSASAETSATNNASSSPSSVFLARTKNGLDFLSEGTRLHDYQVTGVDWITRCYCDRGGCILADDMGLGKTLQSLAFIANLQYGGMNGPHLIVVPCAVVGNWLREIRRFCPKLKCAKVAGGKSEQEWILENAEVRYGERDVYVTTYETLVGNEAFFATIVFHSNF